MVVVGVFKTSHHISTETGTRKKKNTFSKNEIIRVLKTYPIPGQEMRLFLKICTSCYESPTQRTQFSMAESYSSGIEELESGEHCLI